MWRLLFTLGWLIGCNPASRFDEPRPRLTLSPAAVLFPTAAVGALRVRDVAVGNAGQAPLRILPALRLRDASPSISTSWVNPPEHDVIEIAPGAEAHVVVVWLSDGEMVRDALLLESSAGPVDIPIRAGGAQPELHVSPDAVDFGDVRPGEIAEETLTLTNVGVAPLTGLSAWIEGQPGAFALRWTGGADVLDPAEQVRITLRFHPESTDPRRANVILNAANAVAEPVHIPVIGNLHRPCLHAEPVHFRTALVGRTSDLSLTLTPCTDEPVQVQGLRLEGDPAFSVGPPTLPRTVPPGEQLTLPVHFRPNRAGSIRAVVQIQSDDPLRPVTAVPLTGLGVHNACPTAQADAALDGATLLLDGGASTDPDAPDRRPTTWRWSVVDRPEGAHAEVVERADTPDDPSTPSAQFTPDAPGAWRLALTVADVFDCRDEVTLSVVARDGPVDVQLEWVED